MTAFRLLANANNTAPVAEVTASSVLAATRNVFPHPTSRQGNGQVVLSGGYTGANDAEIEIEVRPPVGSGVRVSQPLFAGAGNGTMEQPTAIPGTASQTVTITLADLGTQTAHAQAVLYGDLFLRAKAPGSAGNAIQLTVIPALTLSAQPIGALSAALNADTQEWTDPRHDFGAPPLNPDGTIPVTAPRIAFGRDLDRIYRHYKRWDGDQWRYGVSPKTWVEFAEKSLVHTVTGTYTVIVTDGVTTETYPDLITLYDLLTALAPSALIEPVGVLANDRKPGGMAAMDLPIRTTAFLLPIRSSDPERLPGLQNLAVTDIAPSETVIVECLEAAPIGSERWKVTSVVSGVLPDATTGEVYRAPYVQFAIPAQGVGSDPIKGHMAITGQKFAQNPGPAICLHRPVLGAKAKNQTLTLTWKQRPSTDGCDCRQAPMRGRPSAECLGVSVPGENAMAALTAGYRARLEAITTWLKTFAASNTALDPGGELRTAEQDRLLANLAAEELSACLGDLYADETVLTEPAWQASTDYAMDAAVEPATRNGYRYRCTVAGASGAVEPTWPTTVGDVVTDGGVSWRCVSLTAPLAWSALLTQLIADLSGLSGLDVRSMASVTITAADKITAGIPLPLMDGEPVAGTTTLVRLARDGRLHRYLCVHTEKNAGATVVSYGIPHDGPSEGANSAGGIYPYALYDGTDTHVGFVYWQDLGVVLPGNADINDVTTLARANPGIVSNIEAFVSRYASACNEIRAIAGIVPKSNASSGGSGCWRDPGDAGYWEVNGGESPPVFNGAYYHSVKYSCGSGTFGMPSGAGGAGGVGGGDGISVEPTYEYGFGLKVACPERLNYGDTITITIGDVSINYPYQVGDRYVIPTVSGGPLAFTGGVTGTDTLTWRVESSTQTLPDYPLTLAELAYSAGGLGFAIHRGALAFALGDQFRFAVETGGQWRWRKDGGAWSADADIADSAVLAEGLTVAFVSGAAPSFEDGDVYRYTVRQPHSPAHVQSAHGETWRWSGATATLTLTFPTDHPVAVLGLLRHELIAPATATVTLLDATDVVLHSFVPLIRPGPLLEVLDEPVTARKLSISLTDADEMALGWVYAGLPFFTRHQPSITLKRHWAMERGGERNPRGSYLGRGVSGEIQWENWLMQSEFDDLLALLDACKQDGDAPLVLVPNAEIPGEAALARVDSDALEVSDVFDFQPNPNERRLLSFVLPLAPVLT